MGERRKRQEGERGVSLAWSWRGGWGGGRAVAEGEDFAPGWAGVRGREG